MNPDLRSMLLAQLMAAQKGPSSPRPTRGKRQYGPMSGPARGKPQYGPMSAGGPTPTKGRFMRPLNG